MPPTAATRGSRDFRHVAAVLLPSASSRSLCDLQPPASNSLSPRIPPRSSRPRDCSRRLFVLRIPVPRPPPTPPPLPSRPWATGRGPCHLPRIQATAPAPPPPEPTLQPSSPLSGQSRLQSPSPRLPQAQTPAVTSAAPGIQLSRRWLQVQQPPRAARPECGRASAGR